MVVVVGVSKNGREWRRRIGGREGLNERFGRGRRRKWKGKNQGES